MAQLLDQQEALRAHICQLVVLPHALFRESKTFQRVARPVISHSARAATKIFKSHRSVVSGHCQQANRILEISKSVHSLVLAARRETASVADFGRVTDYL